VFFCIFVKNKTMKYNSNYIVKVKNGVGSEYLVGSKKEFSLSNRIHSVSIIIADKVFRNKKNIKENKNSKLSSFFYEYKQNWLLFSVIFFFVICFILEICMLIEFLLSFYLLTR